MAKVILDVHKGLLVGYMQAFGPTEHAGKSLWESLRNPLVQGKSSLYYKVNLLLWHDKNVLLSAKQLKHNNLS